MAELALVIYRQFLLQILVYFFQSFFNFIIICSGLFEIAKGIKFDFSLLSIKLLFVDNLLTTDNPMFDFFPHQTNFHSKNNTVSSEKVNMLPSISKFNKP